MLVILSFSLRSVNLFFIFMSPFPRVFSNALFAQSALFCTEIIPLFFFFFFPPAAVLIALQLTLLKLSGRNA